MSDVLEKIKKLVLLNFFMIIIHINTTHCILCNGIPSRVFIVYFYIVHVEIPTVFLHLRLHLCLHLYLLI